MEHKSKLTLTAAGGMFDKKREKKNYISHYFNRNALVEDVLQTKLYNLHAPFLYR